MENVKAFLETSNGFGYGYGSGSGSGYGDCSGYGSGYGIKKYNDFNVFVIDEVETIITNIKKNVAKGYILHSDLTLEPCFVIKQNNIFAHGKTLHKAQSALLSKLFNGMSIEERIDVFLEKFSMSEKYPAKDFFDWHGKLTGSCEMGRSAFAKERNIDLESDLLTVDEFIELTESSYGKEVIKKLKERINRHAVQTRKESEEK